MNTNVNTVNTDANNEAAKTLASNTAAHANPHKRVRSPTS